MRFFSFFIIRWNRLQEMHRRMAELRAENEALRQKIGDQE